MRMRDIIGLVVALVLAIGVAFLTRIFLEREEQPTNKEGEKIVTMSRILVAGNKLSEGKKVVPGDLSWQGWPAKAMNPNYIQEGTLNEKDLIGGIVRFPLDQGEPITKNDIVKPGDRSALAAIVAPGMRAVSIEVTAGTASSGLIIPGDYVDVVLSKYVTGTSGEQIGKSETVLSNIKVVAIDTKLSETDDKKTETPKVATLEVKPADAEKILAASKEGTLTLSLHSLAAGKDQTSVEKAEDTETTKVTIMRGKDKTAIEFQE